MSSFLRSIKYLRYIGNVYKHIRINDDHINFRKLSHVSDNVALQMSESNNSFLQSKENGNHDILCIDDIIKPIDDQFRRTRILSKSSIEKIIKLIVETAGQIKTSQVLLTLRYSNCLPQCTPEERVKLVNSLWKHLNFYHIPIEISHYNALLQVYIKNRHEFSPMEILNNMKEQGIFPNEVTYECLLEYYCKSGNMSDSAVVLECMKAEGYPINENIFNLLILGYSQAGDLKSAIEILRIMKKMDIIPTGQTYTAIMCALAKVNDIENINEVLSHCKQRGIQLLNEQILDVIYALIINNNMHHVNKIFSEIKKLSFFEEIYFLSKVMDTKGDIAMNMCFPILSKYKDKVNYNQLVQFFVKKLMHSNSSFESIINACIHFETKYNDKKAFSTAIYFSFQCDNDALTLSLLKAWKNRGCQLRPHYFWPILAKLIKKNDARGLLHNVKEMIVTYNVTPCINTLTDFIIPHVFYNILSIRKELHKCGVPSKVIDNAIVYLFLKQNKMRRAATYVTVNTNLYQESILKDVLQRALHNTCDISSFFAILKNIYKETESGKEERVSISEAILDVMNFISIRTSYIPLIIKYLYDNQLKISNDVAKALSLRLEGDSSSDLLQLLANITEGCSTKQKALSREKEQIQQINLMQELINSSTPNNVTPLH